MSDSVQDNSAAVDELVRTGIRNLWYPVAASWMVKGSPVGLTRLGENIVLWRDSDGEVHALADRCPHRGARLALGWNLGNRLACWYHGVQITGDGKVAKVPAVEKCPLVGEKTNKVYPCKEIAGGIFLYFGDEAHPEPAKLDLPEQLISDEYSHFLCTAMWKCNYGYALDNVMDPMHGAYLHATSHSMAEGATWAEMQVHKTKTGLLFEKSTQRDVNFDWVEFGDSGTLWMRLEIPYRKSAGPGGNFGIIGIVTPIDDQHVQVFFWRTRKVQGWQRDVWRFMYRNRLEGLHWAVLEQDRVVLENLAPNARKHEFLYQHDTGLSRVRRIIRKKAEAQIAELAEASGRNAA